MAKWTDFSTPSLGDLFLLQYSNTVLHCSTVVNGPFSSSYENGLLKPTESSCPIAKKDEPPGPMTFRDKKRWIRCQSSKLYTNRRPILLILAYIFQTSHLVLTDNNFKLVFLLLTTKAQHTKKVFLRY
jgi:hypothetical protein